MFTIEKIELISNNPTFKEVRYALMLAQINHVSIEQCLKKEEIEYHLLYTPYPYNYSIKDWQKILDRQQLRDFIAEYKNTEATKEYFERRSYERYYNRNNRSNMNLYEDAAILDDYGISENMFF